MPARAAALSHDADEATQAAAAAKAAVMPAKRAAAMAPLTVRRLSDLKRRADAALAAAEKKLAGVNAIQSNPNYVITDQARADAGRPRPRMRGRKPPPQPKRWARSSTPPRPT